MVQNRRVIEEKMTQLIAQYISLGYRINYNTMKGTDGTVGVDLVKGNTYICIFIDTVSAYHLSKSNAEIKALRDDLYWDGDIYTLNIGRTTLEYLDTDNVWKSNLDIIYSRPYYIMGRRSWRCKGVTEDLAEVRRACELREQRWERQHINNRVRYTDKKYLELGLSKVKRLPKTKSIHLENIDYIERIDNHYWVRYTTTSGKSQSVIFK